MEEYWLISVPENSKYGDSWLLINDETKALSTNVKFKFPQFKFGNINDLVKFSEESAKVIQCLDTVITKLVQNITNLLVKKEELMNNLQVNSVMVNTYLLSFHWDHMKYPTRKTPQIITTEINDQGAMIFEKLKIKDAEFTTLKNEVGKIEARHTGSLLARDLSDFVKKEDILFNSKFFKTVLILVPSIDIANWQNYYELFWHGIVPGSSKLLFKDNDFGLFTIVVTRDTVDALKAWSLKSRIIVRNFDYNEDEIKSSKINEYKKKMQLTVIQRNFQFWLKKHYSICFSMYVHVIILRAMSESILIYGLNINYTMILIKPKTKYAKQIRSILNHLFCYLEQERSPQIKLTQEEQCFIKQFCGTKDYYPYVNSLVYVNGRPMKTNVELLESIIKGPT